MKLLKKQTFLPLAFFSNILSAMADGITRDETALPSNHTWILLLAGIALGLYKIYKYEKTKNASHTISPKL